MSQSLLSRPFRVVSGSALAALTSISVVSATLAPASAQPVASSASVSSASSFKAMPGAARAKNVKARIKIGNSSYPLAGTNTGRKSGKVVVFRAPRKAAPASKRGVDVLVSRGRVAAIRVHGPKARNGISIPRGTYAISGSGKAARWLRSVARVGTGVGSVRSAAVSTAGYSDAGTTSTAALGLPRKVQAVYHMMWSQSGSPQLRNIPAQVNVVNLAFLQGDVPQLVGWGSQSEASFISDAKALRARGVRIVASVGGAGGHVNIANRAGFVQGVMNVNAKLPLDGLDWDLEGTAMAPADVVWISKRLKQLRGSRFAITLAPNGSNIDGYRAIAVQLQRNGALDMIGQQFYDAPVSKEAAKGRIAQLVGSGIPQSKIGIGMMVGSTANYWTVDECIAAVRFIKASYPGLRGGYLWQHGNAGTSDWANRLASHLRG